MPFKAVLFDMDGVIVDTEPLHRKAYFQAIHDLNIDVSEEPYATFTGASTKKVCDTLIQHFDLSQTSEDIISSKRQYLKDYFDHDNTIILIPGVLGLIQ